MKKDIRNLEKESERLNDNYEQLEEITKLDIKDDATMSSIKKFVTTIYNDLKSRNDSLVKELDTLINCNTIQLSYKNKLNDLKTSMNSLKETIKE